ncbi:hypothetical protein BHE74_00018272 [Ensete ventricosum]|nr:hypothetical protein GW17_00036758 [Ensete ventricosum]RWW73817.1 hypothetical protein BHE74_00018272 [Ensete ventricosum]
MVAKGKRTSTWPARVIFSLLKTEVSKSSDGGGFSTEGTDTIRAPWTALRPPRPPAGTTCRSDMEDDDSEAAEDPRTKVPGAGFWILVQEAGGVDEGAKEIVATAVAAMKWEIGLRARAERRGEKRTRKWCQEAFHSLPCR